MNPPQKNKIICGSNLDVVKSWPSNCIDGICTDPPYGLEFMGKDWDRGLPGIRFWKEFLRITKPGGFLFCFGGTRTFHRLTCAIEDAGWEIRDDIATFIGSDWKLQTFYESLNAEQKGAFEELFLSTQHMMWLYGSGFPKSHGIGKAIDKLKGNQRKKIVSNKQPSGLHRGNIADYSPKNPDNFIPIETQGQSEWEGYGTALKPAWEPIIVAMKPKEGSFANNAEKYGVAGLNIDGGRIQHNEECKMMKAQTDKQSMTGAGKYEQAGRHQAVLELKPQGRWPANLILDEEAGRILDEQSGISKSSNRPRINKRESTKNTMAGKIHRESGSVTHGHSDSGGASRFFYCAKTSRKERNMGLEDCEDKLLARSGRAQGAENRGEEEYLQKHIGLNRMAVVKNNHPTVKPLALMKYLCTLLKMPGDQIILDPFLGSGTTGMACKELGIDFIGIEKEREYCEIAVKRIAAVEGVEVTLQTETPQATLPVSKNVETFRATTDSAGGKCRRPNESLPHISESRQRIINAASAELRKRRNQK